MPYLEDGETWSGVIDVHEEGMAENRPGHKKFAEYSMPTWAKHPLSHPFNGVVVPPKEYMYTAGDGFVNPLGWSVAHIAVKHGDVSLLERATEEELSRQNVEGMTPASYCAQSGTPWCLQWLVEHGADVATPDVNGVTPEDHIWRNASLHVVEQEWLFAALKGELTEKNSIKAQEYRLVKSRAVGSDPKVTERLDLNMRKLRRFHFGLGDYELPYAPPTDERPLDLPISRVEPFSKKQTVLPAALLFPGQGSQYVGMMKDVMDRPAVKDMLQKAEAILGWSPKDLMLDGPEADLVETRRCQPVMVIAGLAALDLLRDTRPEVADAPQAMAGLSLGEYTALIAAGVLDFEDGLRLVKLRAEAMSQAAELVPQAMCSVAGLSREVVDDLCEQAVLADPASGATVKVANVLFPCGFTCGGTQAAVEKLCSLAMDAKALQAKVIKTSGAFHTALMEPAREELAVAVDEASARMRPPRCSVYFNVTGRRIAAGADPATFVELMKMQLTSEVLWEPTIKAMVMDGVKDFYELGPLKQLKAMIKRIDQDAFKRTENISV